MIYPLYLVNIEQEGTKEVLQASYDRALSEGGDPEALDKEYVRRWLGSERGYKGDGPPPEIPVDVRCEAARRYIEAYERITGEAFVPDLEPPEDRIRRNLGL